MPGTSLDFRQSDFNKIVWQCMRKAWLLLILSPFSSENFSPSLTAGVFIHPIGTNFTMNTAN
jgi:hypothetical protein